MLEASCKAQSLGPVAQVKSLGRREKVATQSQNTSFSSGPKLLLTALLQPRQTVQAGKMEDGGGAGSSTDNRRPWTQAEDELIIKLVKEHGLRKWAIVASHLEGRSGKQCRERYKNQASLFRLLTIYPCVPVWRGRCRSCFSLQGYIEFTFRRHSLTHRFGKTHGPRTKIAPSRLHSENLEIDGQR
jgi:hypothetical protein